MVRNILLLLLLALAHNGYAQFWKKSKKKDQAEVSTQPNSLNPNYSQQTFEPKRSKSKGKISYDARQNYYKRLDLVAKERRKAEKEMLKPQYSDPSYFGHKRPPKRHKPGKLKYCKECGLRH